MGILKRTKPASTVDTPREPFVFIMPVAPTPKTSAVKRVTGKAFVLSTPLIMPDDGRTDYREVVKRYKDRIKNPKSAIRAMCVECSGGSLKEVQMCTVVKCALYPFRLGQNPHNKKTKERLAREAAGEVINDDDDDNEEGIEGIEGEE